MIIRRLTLAAVAVAVSCASFAQSAVHYREGQRVDPFEVAHILGSNAAAVAAPRMKTRSIRLLDGEATQYAAAATAPAAAPETAAGPTALSLPVRFAFDSVAIAPEAREQLDALAQGIKMLPGGQRVLIEGHTDATGSDEYNQRLSERRAQTVKRYLVQVHGIEAARLNTSGLGEAQPIEGSHPFAPENRRVQFRGG